MTVYNHSIRNEKFTFQENLKMSLFDHAYYCGMESDREAYDAREEMINATTPEPTPQDEGENVFAQNVWASDKPLD